MGPPGGGSTTAQLTTKLTIRTKAISRIRLPTSFGPGWMVSFFPNFVMIYSWLSTVAMMAR